MELEIIKHNDILFRDLLRAIVIKNAAWPHPIESQVKWIIDNMQSNDLHVFLKDNEADKAYMTLTPVIAAVDGSATPFMGVGCVCVANPGMGGGKKLLHSVNSILQEKNQKGLLFCKKDLIGFYSKCNWKVLPAESVHFNTEHGGVFTMTFNCGEIEQLDYQDRFF